MSAELRIHADECCKKLLKKRQAISEFETMKNKTAERIKLKVQENIEKEQTELQANLKKRKLDPHTKCFPYLYLQGFFKISTKSVSYGLFIFSLFILALIFSEERSSFILL